MTYQEKLIKFVELKNEVIENETGIKYIKEADIEDIETWDEDECKFVYRELSEVIMYSDKKGLTYHTCIWCIINTDPVAGCMECFDCHYGKHNGVCDDHGSLYRKYDTDEAIELLTNDVYKEMIRKIENQ